MAVFSTMTRIHHWDHEDAPITESMVLKRIETALDQVVEELGLDSNQSSVKYQKYTYLTAKEFAGDGQFPVTYSWFKWGASAIAGKSNGSHGASLETRTTGAQEILEKDLDEIKETILDASSQLPIRQYWEEDQLAFLEKFYREYAPNEYRQLYLANIDIQKQIDLINLAVQQRNDVIGLENYKKVCNSTTELEYAVLNTEAVQEEYSRVRYFNELFRDSVLALSDIGANNISVGQQTAIDQLVRLYNDFVWPLIAHRLSRASADGPNIQNVLDWSGENIDTIEDEFEARVEEKDFRDICEAVELLREFKKYPDANHQYSATQSVTEPRVQRMLNQRTAYPEVDEYISEYGIQTLADLIDLAPKHADGKATFRGIADALSVPKLTILEVLDTIKSECQVASEPRIINPDDINAEARDSLLTDGSQ